MSTAFADAIATAENELVVEVARTPEQVIEAKKLRYRVYCQERGFEPGEGGLEQDAYDDHAHHVLVRNRATGEVFGTVRVVLSGHDNSLGFPMQRVCDDHILSPLPKAGTGEISRFALTRDRTGISPASAALMRLCLIQGIVQISGDVGLTHWCAIMEKTLLRLLRSTSIYFLPVGPTVEYHGTRQPAIWTLSGGLERMRLEKPQLWVFLTRDGTLWSEMTTGNSSQEERLAA